MTDTVESLRREVDRLRRELAYAIEAARENGRERDELAFKLGAEVAENERMRAAAMVMDQAWDKFDRCVEAGFAAEERPDIARARVIRAARELHTALSRKVDGGK